MSRRGETITAILHLLKQSPGLTIYNLCAVLNEDSREKIEAALLRARKRGKVYSNRAYNEKEQHWYIANAD